MRFDLKRKKFKLLTILGSTNKRRLRFFCFISYPPSACCVSKPDQKQIHSHLYPRPERCYFRAFNFGPVYSNFFDWNVQTLGDVEEFHVESPGNKGGSGNVKLCSSTCWWKVQRLPSFNMKTSKK